MASTIVRDVILRDGSALRLRSPRPGDEPAIKAFFDGLAPESRYMRFHGVGRTDLVARDYAQADGDARVALLARLGGRVGAGAGYHRLNEPTAPRSRSRSPTRCRAAAWRRGCSSSSPR